jgi:histidine triad (HIT) family protein
VHLIPLNEMKDMSFKHKIAMDNEAFIALAKKIKSNY